MSELQLTFRLRDRPGVIAVRVEPNTHPDASGHELIASNYDRAAFAGFPLATATITYDGYGPRAWLGWLQVVERHDVDGMVSRAVDSARVPDDASPFYVFGYCPTFADAPANPDHPDGEWRAHTFLAYIPDVVHSRVLRPVTGFRWGYQLKGGRPRTLHAPLPIGALEWSASRALLETEFPGWRFEDVDET